MSPRRNKLRRWLQYLVSIYPDSTTAFGINDKWATIREISHKLRGCEVVERIIGVTGNPRPIRIVNAYRIKDEFMGV